MQSELGIFAVPGPQTPSRQPSVPRLTPVWPSGPRPAVTIRRSVRTTGGV